MAAIKVYVYILYNIIVYIYIYIYIYIYGGFLRILPTKSAKDRILAGWLLVRNNGWLGGSWWNYLTGPVNFDEFLAPWTFQRMPNVPNGCWRVSIYHLLGLNWHPLEGAGTLIQWYLDQIGVLFKSPKMESVAHDWFLG